MKKNYVSSLKYINHLTGPGHPECPDRITTILKTLNINTLSPRMATIEELQLCHTPAYIELVKQECEAARQLRFLSTGDVVICEESFEVAKLAVGGVLAGVDVVLKGEAQNVFCAVRPPGHHACSDRGMGFCLFNNVAIGARYAIQTYGIKRVLIVDWDVHHGNGTEEIFYNDPSVFYFSTHACGIYPGTGTKSKEGILNCPIKGSREEVFDAFYHRLVPAMDSFKPELIFISAGFDAHLLDPIGTLDLKSDDFATLTEIVKGIAANYSNNRIVSVLEGGYHLEALQESVILHMRSLE